MRKPSGSLKECVSEHKKQRITWPKGWHVPKDTRGEKLNDTKGTWKSRGRRLGQGGVGQWSSSTHRMYMMTPRDHISHDLSYFSGPRTSGAARAESINLSAPRVLGTRKES